MLAAVDHPEAGLTVPPSCVMRPLPGAGSTLASLVTPARYVTPERLLSGPKTISGISVSALPLQSPE